MISPAKICKPRGQPAGFTLLELMIAITIASLFITLIAMHGRPRSAGLEENGTASELAGGLREARAQAIVQNKPYVKFTFLPSGALNLDSTVQWDLTLRNLHQVSSGATPARP